MTLKSMFQGHRLKLLASFHLDETEVRRLLLVENLKSTFYNDVEGQEFFFVFNFV